MPLVDTRECGANTTRLCNTLGYCVIWIFTFIHIFAQQRLLWLSGVGETTNNTQHTKQQYPSNCSPINNSIPFA